MKNLDQIKYHTFRANLRINAFSALSGSDDFSDKEADKYLSDTRHHLEKALLHLDELDTLRMMDSMKEKEK